MTKKEFKKMSAFLAGPAVGRTFEEILNITDPSEFIRALAEYDFRKPAWSVSEIRARPELSRMVLLLNALCSCVCSGGIGKFLREPDAPVFFEEIVGYCKRIGAHRTVEYLRSVAAYFPDGKIPTDQAQRDHVLDLLESNEACHGFRNEDARYVGVMDEMLELFRRYVLANSDQFSQVLRGGS